MQLKETATPPSMAGRVHGRVHVRVTARMKVWVNVRMQERQARSRCRQTQECIVSLAKDGGGQLRQGDGCLRCCDARRLWLVRERRQRAQVKRRWVARRRRHLRRSLGEGSFPV